MGTTREKLRHRSSECELPRRAVSAGCSRLFRTYSSTHYGRLWRLLPSDVVISAGKESMSLQFAPLQTALNAFPSSPCTLSSNANSIRHRGVAVKGAQNRHCTAEEAGAPCGASFTSFHRIPTSPCGVPYCSEPSPVNFWLAGKKRHGVGPERRPPDANGTKLMVNSGWNLLKLFRCYEGYSPRYLGSKMQCASSY